MKARLFHAATGLALLFACGGDDSSLNAANDNKIDAGTDDGSAFVDGAQSDGTVADAGPPPPTRAPFGLDSRPANATCLAAARPVLNTPMKLQQVWTPLTFNAPIYVTQAPGDNDRWFVVERGGTVRVFASAATTEAEVKNFVSRSVDAVGEGGLLGFAFHPNWQANHEAYLSYTRASVGGDTPFPPRCAGADSPFTSVIARYKSADGGQTLAPAADEILNTVQPYSNHDGGNIQFGPDGMLYIGFGDGGSGNDPCGNGQQLDSVFGKMLRIDVNAGPGAYVVPPTNPFVSTPGAHKAIWAYGLRNPFRWSFDRATGDLWVGDVGQDTWEEVDIVKAGGNYGWNTCEGFHQRGSQNLCQTAGLLDPVVEHPRGEARAIIGGYVYRGSAMPSLVGTYIYGDYATGNIWTITYDANNKPKSTVVANLPAQTLVSFGQGNDGELYAVRQDGQILKLVPNGSPPVDTFPKLLSLTGCVDTKDPTLPASGVIPYDIVSPLWSDGAKKERWLALPYGAKITVGADGDWDLPNGSVAMKKFSVGGKPVETRLFMRHSDGAWAGYTYEWNDQATDAVLLPAGKTKSLGAQTWTYPSRSQCIQCHSTAAGGTLGLETAQLNRDAVYPTTNRIADELATLDHIGMFAAPIGASATLPKLPDPVGTDPLDLRARSYIHANCAHCHRPAGGAQGTMDLRFAKSFKDTVTCNAVPQQGLVGPADAKLLFPGDPAKSIISLRVHATGAKRMPPVGVTILDPIGSKLLDDWIVSVTTCP